MFKKKTTPGDTMLEWERERERGEERKEKRERKKGLLEKKIIYFA